MVQRSLFDHQDEPAEKKDEEPAIKEETMIPSVFKPIMPSGDCRFRKDDRCSKTGKKITLDIRDPDNISCWDRMNCKLFEKV
jgi:hypothetical protein